MANTISTLAMFTTYVPTAIGSDFDTISPYITKAERTIKANITGKSLYDEIIASTDNEELKEALLSLVCNTAYYSAIPFVDLIQTPNGFAVVNNSNQAPASKERVERLLEQVEKEISENTDYILSAVIENTELIALWKLVPTFLKQTNSLFITGAEFANAVGFLFENQRKEFFYAKPHLLSWESTIIRQVIGTNLHKQIIEQRRSASITEANKKIMQMCYALLAHLWITRGQDDIQVEKATRQIKDSIIRYLNENKADYLAYTSSAEYIAREAPVYENKASDSTFFSC